MSADLSEPSEEQDNDIERFTEWMSRIVQHDHKYFMDHFIYGKQLANENAIWLHDYGWFGDYLQFARLLDILLLLYDKIFWYEPCSSLVIRDAWREKLHAKPSLIQSGLDESFPERLIEYVKRGAVIPIGTDYGPPVEDNLQLEMAVHRIECHGVHTAILKAENRLEIERLMHNWVRIRLESDPVWREQYSHWGDFFNELLVNFILLPKIFGAKSVLLTPEGVGRLINIAYSSHSNCEFQENSILPSSADMEFIQEVSCFLEKLLLCAPCRLGIDDIWSFREEDVTKEFRSWLANAYHIAETRLVNVPKADYLVAAFNDMSKAYVNRSGTWVEEAALSGIVASLGAIIGGVPGAAIGGAGSIAVHQGFKWIINRRHRSRNDHKWVFALHNMTPRSDGNTKKNG